MSAAMGLGCRAGVAAQEVLSAIAAARAKVEAPLVGLHTSARKRAEAGLSEAAARLGLTLSYHDDETLRAQRLGTPSAKVAGLIGLSSVAEAAALAGAGEGARLILAKQSFGAVTCAIALPRESAA